jgi:hypothetical protein
MPFFQHGILGHISAAVSRQNYTNPNLRNGHEFIWLEELPGIGCCVTHSVMWSAGKLVARFHFDRNSPHSGILAGGGVKRGAVIGKTDADGWKVVDYGWSAKRSIYMEDIACTIYSALGIDWTKKIVNTPSGRAFHYVEPASGTEYVGFKPVQEFFA